jgi:hypothetical protein
VFDLLSSLFGHLMIMEYLLLEFSGTKGKSAIDRDNMGQDGANSSTTS